MPEAIGKLLAMCGVVLLALAISPTGEFIDPHDSWVIIQWKWIQRAIKQNHYATAVTINPLWLYLGLLLSLVGIALS